MARVCSQIGREQKDMSIDNGPSGIIAVAAEQIAIALALFRAAVSDEASQEPILPITDRGICTALIEPDALQRGVGVLRIHFESHDSIHPVVQRLICFLHLLREQHGRPSQLWNEIVTHHNRYISIANAIAWCPAQKDKAFDLVMFAKLAGHMTNGPGDCSALVV